jgi:hypothetical protein
MPEHSTSKASPVSVPIQTNRQAYLPAMMDPNGFQMYSSSHQHLNFYGQSFPQGMFHPGFLPESEPLPNNYKTKRCRHFDSGRCKLGGLCNFAHGEEELQRFRSKESVKRDGCPPSDKAARQPYQNSTCKIQQLEKRLKDFYEQQKSTLEHLKFLTLNLSASGQTSPEDQVSGIEANITRLYNDSVNFANTVNSVLEVGGENKQSVNEILSDKQDHSTPRSTCGHDSRHSNISEILEQEEDGLASIKSQMEFILTQLRALHSPTNTKSKWNFEAVLDNAAKALSNNKVIEGSQCLQSVLYHDKLDARTRRLHGKIIEQAKEIS